MTRQQIEVLVGRPLSNTEWLEISQVLGDLERHPDADAILDRCIDSGATVEELVQELSKRPTTR